MITLSQYEYLYDYASKGNRRYSDESLKCELRDYAKKGIKLSIRGRGAAPEDIALICSVREAETAYMRDYVAGEDGRIETIDFVRVEG